VPLCPSPAWWCRLLLANLAACCSVEQNHQGANDGVRGRPEQAQAITRMRSARLRPGSADAEQDTNKWIREFERDASAVLEFVYSTQLENAACKKTHEPRPNRQVCYCCCPSATVLWRCQRATRTLTNGEGCKDFLLLVFLPLRPNRFWEDVCVTMDGPDQLVPAAWELLVQGRPCIGVAQAIPIDSGDLAPGISPSPRQLKLGACTERDGPQPLQVQPSPV